MTGFDKRWNGGSAASERRVGDEEWMDVYKKQTKRLYGMQKYKNQRKRRAKLLIQKCRS